MSISRRKFIVSSILTGTALSVVPFQVFSRSNFRTLLLPPVNFHVRHGLLLSPEISKPSNLPHWVDSFERDVFYANGFEASEEDVYSTRLKFGENSLQILIDSDSIWTTINECSIELDRNKEIQQTFNVIGDFEALLTSKKKVKLTHKDEVFAFCIRGKAVLGNMSLSEKRAISGNHLKDEWLESVTDDSLILLIRSKA